MIPLSECKHGFVYKVEARNILYGVFNQHTKGFIGVREKFGDYFLDTEFHHDTGAPFGTARPVLELMQVPEDVAVCELLSDESENKPLFDFLRTRRQ